MCMRRPLPPSSLMWTPTGWSARARQWYAAAGHLTHRALRRHVGEREAFGGKADLGAARVLERPQICPDAIVGARSLTGIVRKCAAMGARGPVGHVGACLLREPRELLMKQA